MRTAAASVARGACLSRQGTPVVTTSDDRLRISADEARPVQPTAASTLDERTLRAILDSSPDVDFWLRPDGRLAWVSPAARRLLGRDPADCVTLSDFPAAIVAEPDRAAVHAHVTAALAGETPDGLPCRVPLPDGTTRRCLLTCGPLGRSDGTLLGCRGRLSDGAAIHEARRAVAHQQALFAYGPIVLFHWAGDDVWTVRYVSSNVETVLGYGPAELIDAAPGYAGLVHPDDAPGVATRLAEQVQLGAAHFEHEYRLRHADGTYRWVHEYTRIARDASGRADHYHGYVLDITSLKEAELRLRTSEERFRGVFEHATVGIFQTAPDGRLLTANPAFARLLGYASAAQMLMEVQDVRRQLYVHPESRDALVARALAGEVLVRSPSEYRRRDGSIMVGELTLAAVRDDRGQLVCLQGFIEDVTERRRMEEERRNLEQQVLRAQKLESLGVLAGGVAHDFNNLLTGILGNASFAREQLPPDNSLVPLLQQIEQAALSATDLTRQMLAYSGKGRFVVEPVDISAIVAGLDHLIRAAVPRTATLDLALAPELPYIEADAAQLRQVVMNLVTNAAEALVAQAGAVRVATGHGHGPDLVPPAATIDGAVPAGPAVFLEVTDTGCGMDAATRGRVFEPYFSTKFVGRGLGLPAVQGIVRGHRGAIALVTDPTHGTRVRVLLPTIAVPQPAEPAPPPPPARTATVLVVDDEEGVRSIARLALERHGFQVLDAADGRTALDVFAAHANAIDVVLLDVAMPELSGDEVCRELRRRRPDLRVILSSGYNDGRAQHAGDGATAFLQKPYRVGTLIDTVRGVLPG
jgi:two-component system cell cycle sensor histidine kinase/response regulator CckA